MTESNDFYNVKIVRDGAGYETLKLIFKPEQKPEDFVKMLGIELTPEQKQKVIEKYFTLTPEDHEKIHQFLTQNQGDLTND